MVAISRRIIADHEIEAFSFYDIAFIGSDLVLAGVSGGEFGDLEAGLILIERNSGAIKWRQHLVGIGVTLAVHPSQQHVVVGCGSSDVRYYSTADWSLSKLRPFKCSGDSDVICSLAFTHAGDRLTYGTAGGQFDIIDFNS